jgi:hypothetical protein
MLVSLAGDGIPLELRAARSTRTRASCSRPGKAAGGKREALDRQAGQAGHLKHTPAPYLKRIYSALIAPESKSSKYRAIERERRARWHVARGTFSFSFSFSFSVFGCGSQVSKPRPAPRAACVVFVIAWMFLFLFLFLF